MNTSEIAEKAGYASASAFGKSVGTLDHLCEKHKIVPMVLGKLKYYPRQRIEKILADGLADPGMVSASQWCMQNGLARAQIREDIDRGRYKGRFKKGLLPGVLAKAQYLVYPDEAAAQYLKKPEPKVPTPATPPEWLTLGAASEFSKIPKNILRSLVEDGCIDSRAGTDTHTGGRELLIETASLRAYLEPPKVQPEVVAIAPAPAPAIVPEAPAETLRLAREAGERQRELHAKMVDVLAKIEERAATRNAQFFANLRSRDEKLVEAIKEAIAGALDDFEKKVLSDGGSVALLAKIASKVSRISEDFEINRSRIISTAMSAKATG